MKFKDRVKRYLSEQTIDKTDVMDYAYDLALDKYGDDVKTSEITKMVDKVIKKSKTEKEAKEALKKMFEDK